MVFLLCPLHTALDSCKLYLCWKSTKSFQEYFHPHTENFLQRFREKTKDHGASAEVSLSITSDRFVISNLHRLRLFPSDAHEERGRIFGFMNGWWEHSSNLSWATKALIYTFCLSWRPPLWRLGFVKTVQEPEASAPHRGKGCFALVI